MTSKNFTEVKRYDNWSIRTYSNGNVVDCHRNANGYTSTYNRHTGENGWEYNYGNGWVKDHNGNWQYRR